MTFIQDENPSASTVSHWSEHIMQTIDIERLRSTVQRLSTPRNRLHAPAAMEQAEAFILQSFRESGWMAERHAFQVQQAAGITDYEPVKMITYPLLEGGNIIASKPGIDTTKAFLILSHFDTIRDSPGADDNTASVAALLELASTIAPYQFHYTILLAVTDMEELGYWGAKALITELMCTYQLLGVINYETMAYTSSQPNSQMVPAAMRLLYPKQTRQIIQHQRKGDFTVIIHDGNAKQLAVSFAQGLALTVGEPTPLLLCDPRDLPIVGRLLRLLAVGRVFARSDHVPFWEAHIPAIMITDTANLRNPHYHKPSDTFDTLDYQRLAAIVGATSITLANVALKK